MLWYSYSKTFGSPKVKTVLFAKVWTVDKITSTPSKLTTVGLLTIPVPVTKAPTLIPPVTVSTGILVTPAGVPLTWAVPVWFCIVDIETLSITFILFVSDSLYKISISSTFKILCIWVEL